MKRILAIDFGEKRLGLAVSGPLNITAQGLETVKRKDSLKAIKSLISQYVISKIVVGLPLNMNGTKGARAVATEEFVESLKKGTGIDIELIDERLTSAQGERMLLEADVSRSKRKSSIDKIAAQLILQTYLDSRFTTPGPGSTRPGSGGGE